MQVLEKLFGSNYRVKLMKLFLFEPDQNLLKTDIIKKTKVPLSAFNKEIKLLEEAGMVKRQIKNKRQIFFKLNPEFRFLNQMKGLLIQNEPLQPHEIIKRVSKAGKIKLIITSGIFIQNEDSRIDILIVGDEIKERQMKQVISSMESEVGKELRYTIFNTSDFKYRNSVCDRLIRDIFDYPHQVIIDRVGL